MPKEPLDEMFVIRDKDTNEPVPNMPYRIERADGVVFTGVSNDRGETIRTGGFRADQITLYVL
jgi:uncharacterized protein (DUF2345 family)